LIVQPEAFFRHSAFEKVGRIREELFYCFDVRLWMDMAREGCAFHSVDRHWANLRIHKDQKIQNMAGNYKELAGVAWTQLRENWATVEDPLSIADEIFSVLDLVITLERDASKRLRESKSYRIGRSLTNIMRTLIPAAK